MWMRAEPYRDMQSVDRGIELIQVNAFGQFVRPAYDHKGRRYNSCKPAIPARPRWTTFWTAGWPCWVLISARSQAAAANCSKRSRGAAQVATLAKPASWT